MNERVAELWGPIAEFLRGPVVKERPILFSAPMVRAILDGRKTQTRRVVRDRGRRGDLVGDHVKWFERGQQDPTRCGHDGLGSLGWVRCPYGEPGDRLWVRETWQAIRVWDGEAEAADSIPKERGIWGVAYAATDEQASWHKDDRGFVWRPGIHMPRWASRISLNITHIRVERLHDITDKDARAEGCLGRPDIVDLTPREEFEELWKDINGLDSWRSNPWVWVVEFKP